MVLKGQPSLPVLPHRLCPSDFSVPLVQEDTTTLTLLTYSVLRFLIPSEGRGIEASPVSETSCLILPVYVVLVWSSICVLFDPDRIRSYFYIFTSCPVSNSLIYWSLSSTYTCCFTVSVGSWTRHIQKFFRQVRRR